MNNKVKIQKLVGAASLLALVVVLQLLSNYVQFGPISITLALIPISMGAILYGPLVGLFLGLVMGAMVLVAPSTSFFLSYNVWFTILLCLVKSGLAGLISGLLFKGIMKIKAFKKGKFETSIIVASLVTPIVNTGIFIIGALFLFTGLYSDTSNLGEALGAIVAATLTINFVIEFIISAVASPALVYLTKVLAKQRNLGFQKEFNIETKKDESLTTKDVNSDNLFS